MCTSTVTAKKDRKGWARAPLFPNNVFVEARLERRREIEKVFQIIRFVQIGKEYAKFAPKDVELIKRLNDYADPITVEQSYLLAGQKVEIQNDVFLGLQDKVIDPCRNSKVYLAIERLRYYVPVKSSGQQYRILEQAAGQTSWVRRDIPSWATGCGAIRPLD